MAYVDKAKVMGSLLMKEQGAERDRSIDLTFGRDKDFVSLEVLTRTPGAAPLRVVNEDYLKQYKLDKGFIDTLRTAIGPWDEARVHDAYSPQLACLTASSTGTPAL